MRRVIIMGAGGRDFHNFNTVFRNDSDTTVVAFTAAQIPGIADRVYPRSLAGALYPQGIPILAEERLTEPIAEHAGGGVVHNIVAELLGLPVDRVSVKATEIVLYPA